MLFNSVLYLFFFVLVVTLFYVLPHRLRWYMLLAASCWFYMAWRPELIALLLFAAFVNYGCSLLIARTEDPRRKKAFLALALVICFGLLLFFKYLTFINRSLMAAFGFFSLRYPVADFDILLPMGISFFTFQSVSYTIDIYRNDYPPEHNFLKFALFISFFPQLVAGPIERADSLMPSIFERKKFKLSNMEAGVKQMLIGFFKKVVVADRLAVVVNAVFNSPEYHRGLPSIIATLFFAFQIYCDFGGYSDIAAGSARCMGIDLMQNFRQPYLSAGVREFWRRWHISLSTWFRDYLYIPLGGNRVSKARKTFNTMVTFTVSGLWHGANWTFVIWGALHGAFQTAETWLAGRFSFWRGRRGAFVRVPLTFIAVCFAWIFFRANTAKDAFGIIGGLFSNAGQWGDKLFLYDTFTSMGVDLLTLTIDAAVVVLVVLLDLIGRDANPYAVVERRPMAVRGVFYFVIIALICALGVFDSAGQFIYFQF